MERQLWRLLDIHKGSFGFTLELYFLSIGKILSTFSPLVAPRGTHRMVFLKTFKAITFDWYKFQSSTGTRQVILNIVLDIAFRDRGIFSNVRYPEYITDELLGLLRGLPVEQADAYHDVEDAKREIHDGNLTPSTMVDPQFLLTAKKIFGPLHASPPALAPIPAAAPAPRPILSPSTLSLTPEPEPEPEPVPAPRAILGPSTPPLTAKPAPAPSPSPAPAPRAILGPLASSPAPAPAPHE